MICQTDFRMFSTAFDLQAATKFLTMAAQFQEQFHVHGVFINWINVIYTNSNDDLVVELKEYNTAGEWIKATYVFCFGKNKLTVYKKLAYDLKSQDVKAINVFETNLHPQVTCQDLYFYLCKVFLTYSK